MSRLFFIASSLLRSIKLKGAEEKSSAPFVCKDNLN